MDELYKYEITNKRSRNEKKSKTNEMTKNQKQKNYAKILVPRLLFHPRKTLVYIMHELLIHDISSYS